MRKLNLAEGSLIFIGFVFILNGAVYKLSGLNAFDPFIVRPSSFFTLANTCFLTTLIISMFDKPGE